MQRERYRLTTFVFFFCGDPKTMEVCCLTNLPNIEQKLIFLQPLKLFQEHIQVVK